MNYDYQYCANPVIYFFPRALKDLLKEEKTTVDGVESTEKKCELKDILSTYEDGDSYTLAGKKFKKIENRIYLDLGKINESSNEYTVTKKVCVGFLAKHDDTYDFMKAETKYYSLLLKCETDNNAFSSYLVYEDQNNSKDPSKPISINLNNSPYKIKELSIVVKYSATNIPDNAKLKIHATFCNISGWSHTFTLDIYRNTENSLDDFKQSSGKDTDFFVLPRVMPNESQRKCIKQLKIINNQVFSRNKKFRNFSFLNETEDFINNNGTFDKTSYNNLKNNIFNSIDSFRTNNTDFSKGCRSNNPIGNFRTIYNFNFLNYGPDEEFIEYLSNNFGIGINDLKGIVLDRKFLLGSCISKNPYAQYEGIVNLYKRVVVPFVSDFINQLQSFLNHNVPYLSCPAYNENYHRGPLTIGNISKCLYIGESTTEKSLSSMFQGYTGNNILPKNSVVEFHPGKDNHCFNTTSENYYKVSSITIPKYGTKTFTESENICIKLSNKDKQLCFDIKYNCNRGNYTSTVEVTDTKDIVGINNYGNYGIPYYMNGMDSQNNAECAKLTKTQLLNWNENATNWYSYVKKPNTGSFGIDCSGLVVNSLLSIKDNPNSVIKFYSTASAARELDVNANTMGGNTNCRQIANNLNFGNNTIIQQSDVVYISTHIGICNEGNIVNNFENNYISSTNKQNRYFNVIHNYGGTNVRLTDNTFCSKCFFYKTIEGPANHWNVNNLNFSRIYLWN